MRPCVDQALDGLDATPGAGSPASVRQASCGWSSTSTVQAPHSPPSQPCLVPVRPSVSRSTSSSRVLSATACCSLRSFTLRLSRLLLTVSCSSGLPPLFPCAQGRSIPSYGAILVSECDKRIDLVQPLGAAAIRAKPRGVPALVSYRFAIKSIEARWRLSAHCSRSCRVARADDGGEANPSMPGAWPQALARHKQSPGLFVSGLSPPPSAYGRRLLLYFQYSLTHHPRLASTVPCSTPPTAALLRRCA